MGRDVLTGSRSLREGPLRAWVPSQRRTTKRLTGSALQGRTVLMGRAGPCRDPELGGNFCSCAVDQKRPFLIRVGPFLDLLPFKGPFPLQDPLRGGPYGNAPYGEGFLREGPLRALYGKPLTGNPVLTGRAGPYRDPELGGNFRLCAVDQKKSFFPRVGPFLGLLPFKGPFPLTGALTGRPPYGASYGEASYGEGHPREAGPYGRWRTTKRLMGRLGLYGKPLTGKGRAGPWAVSGPSAL